MSHGEAASAPSRRDRWPFGLACAHVLHTLWFARQYPDGVYDPDLIAYFVYWKNWLAGATSLHDAPYFMVPKPLPVLLLGPLDSAPAAFAVSVLAAGVLGSLVYRIGHALFGRTTGILCSLALLLDVDRASLALHSSADFHLTVLLFAAIWASLSRRWVLSGLAIALAALVKPVALPCALHLLAVQGSDRRRAWCAAALPLLALPATLLANQALLGSALGAHHLFGEFAAMTEGTPMATGDLVRFALWVGLVKTIFVSSAPFGLLGLATWLGADVRRLTNPFLLVPGLFLLGYVALSVTTPFVAYFRFFWPLQVWFLCCIIAGIVETARRLAPEARGLRVAILVGLLAFVVDGQLARDLAYRTRFAGPSNDAMQFVGLTEQVLARERTPGQTILAPVAYLPYLLWTQDELRAFPALVRTADTWGQDGGTALPDWVYWVPQAFLRSETRRAVEALLAQGGYRPAVTDGRGTAALFVRTPGYDRVAALAAQD